MPAVAIELSDNCIAELVNPRRFADHVQPVIRSESAGFVTAECPLGGADLTALIYDRSVEEHADLVRGGLALEPDLVRRVKTGHVFRELIDAGPVGGVFDDVAEPLGHVADATIFFDGSGGVECTPGGRLLDELSEAVVVQHLSRKMAKHSSEDDVDLSGPPQGIAAQMIAVRDYVAGHILDGDHPVPGRI